MKLGLDIAESFRIAQGTPDPGPNGLEDDLFAGL